MARKRRADDWPDRETKALLARCAGAALPASRLLVVGGVAPDDAPRRLTIEMVLVGGRTDTLTEFFARAADAGLEVTDRARLGRALRRRVPTDVEWLTDDL